MLTQATKYIPRFGIALLLVLGCSRVAQAQWTRVGDGSGNTGTAPSAGPLSATTCLLLTDGSVMCQEDSNPYPSGSVNALQWWRLTPSNTGSYETGTWSRLQDAPSGYGPLFYCSAVLADGRVVVIGGEYNLKTSAAAETTLGYIFDPTANGGAGQWGSSPISLGTTGWTQIGDSICAVRADKTFIIAGFGNGQMASLDLGTQTLSLVNSPNLENSKADANGQEGWTLLPDGTILTVDTSIPPSTGEFNITAGVSNIAEIFNPVTNLWASTVSTGPVLDGNVPSCCVPEMGPQILRPDGTVIAFGATPNTATYNYKTGNWTAGPTFPIAVASYPSSCGGSGTNYSSAGAADGPGSLLTDGNVLVASSPVNSAGNELNCSSFFEFDGTNLNTVTGPPDASSVPTFEMRMLLLPSGHVLFTDTTGDVEIYTPSGTYQSAWQPTITSAPTNPGQGESYTISGTQFNGLSQASAYGDDATMATNYPLVRIVNNGTGHVFYARTHDHSTMGVATGSSIVSTTFDVPTGIETGASQLFVVANGIPSAPFSVNVGLGTALTLTGASATSSDFNDAVTVQAQLMSGGSPVPTSETVTFVLGSGFGTETCSTTTNPMSGIASCPITPNQPAGSYTLTATFGGDATYGASSASAAFTILLEDTVIAFTGTSATNADFDDAATVGAVLTDPTDGTPIQGKMVTFTLGSGGGTETCAPMTGPSGLAICQITPSQQAGPYTITATFAGDGSDAASSTSAPFIINKEETTTKFTVSSPTVIANGHPTTFSATLLEDGVTPIQGRTITIAIGSQSCPAGPTDPTGTASCTIVLSQVLGPSTVTASFAGDPFYLPSSTSESVIVFAFLNSGSMVIGNLNAATGNAVTFWGAQWAKVNSLSGGSAPNSFKGFADTAPQSCGGSWTGDPGNSGGPPASVPSYMGVIASSTIIKSGSNIAGDVPIIIVVKTNPGYGPSPGHAGTGTVVAFFCH
jgi:hypothetical protein